MKKSKKRDANQPATIAPLRDDELTHVTGGDGIVSPRDAASGLPTGKRM